MEIRLYSFLNDNIKLRKPYPYVREILFSEKSTKKAVHKS